MVQEDDTYVLHGPEPDQPLLNISLGQLVYENFLANCEKGDALVDAHTGKTLSYQELLEITCSLAESMRRNGLGKDTVVSVSSENSIYFFIPVIAAMYLGATVAPINHNYTLEETTHSLNICQPKVIFCSKAVRDKFVMLRKKMSFIEKIILIDTDDEFLGVESMTCFIERALRGVKIVNSFRLEKFDASKQVALIMCSSGTTGLPKGVMQTHSNLMVRYMHTIDPRYSRKCDSFLGILPFFHGFGMTTTFFALVLGQKVIVIKRFQEELFLKTIHDYKISVLWLAPPLVVFLAKSPLVLNYDLSCIREISSGAAPLSKETEAAVTNRLKISFIRQGYGLTEATLAVMILPIDKPKPGSSGQVISFMSCKVRDPETGKSLGPNQIGEICIKGPMVMPGYYRNEEATKNSFTSDGWLLTGDLGYYDKEGYFYIVDRLKELIKYKGFQVAPAELEAIILSNPRVKDVGVVGVPDDEAGELPLAFVVKNDQSLTEKDIIDFVANKVSSQKRLRGGVIFVPAIPKNPSGKILRRELRQMLTTHKSKL